MNAILYILLLFSGIMKAGVNAIMGPSGSGKTRWGDVLVYIWNYHSIV